MILPPAPIRVAASLAIALLAVISTGRAQAQTSIALGATCITTDCHAEVEEHTFLHGPVNLGQCAPCHVPVEDKHEFEVVSSAQCAMCHEPEASQAVVHEPFAEDCTKCHSPHGEQNRFFVKGGTGAGGCYQCHEDEREHMAFVHGPVAMGECLACHTAHQSEHPKLLTDPKEQLCGACHVEMEARIRGGVSIHEPAQGDCTGCHDPHGSQSAALTRTSGKDLCASCHEDFIDQMDDFAFTHTPMTEGRACANCHDPHASDQEHLLASKTMDLCLSCHDKSIKTEHGVLANIAKEIENASFVHGPLREGNCVACHEAHGSEHAKLLDRAFPETFYAEFSEAQYAICFECHDKALITEEESSLTGFRNGTENLHFLHVNRKKGRSCRACHSPHATNQAKHIREDVAFGRWKMELTFETTPTGGSCIAGCHTNYRYDREVAADNSRPKK